MTTPLLCVESLTKSFGGLVALDHTSLSVQTGEIHALIGPNGAGKTTLIHHISGAMHADAGRIVFDGHDVTQLPPTPACASRLGSFLSNHQCVSAFECARQLGFGNSCDSEKWSWLLEAGKY